MNFPLYFWNNIEMFQTTIYAFLASINWPLSVAMWNNQMGVISICLPVWQVKQLPFLGTNSGSSKKTEFKQSGNLPLLGTLDPGPEVTTSLLPLTIGIFFGRVAPNHWSCTPVSNSLHMLLVKAPLLMVDPARFVVKTSSALSLNSVEPTIFILQSFVSKSQAFFHPKKYYHPPHFVKVNESTANLHFQQLNTQELG